MVGLLVLGVNLAIIHNGGVNSWCEIEVMTLFLILEGKKSLLGSESSRDRS